MTEKEKNLRERNETRTLRKEVFLKLKIERKEHSLNSTTGHKM